MSFIHLNINKTKMYSTTWWDLYFKKCCSINEAKSSEKLKMTPIFLQKQCLNLWLIGSLHGGPKFLFKIIPVATLNAEFLREKVYQTIYNIEAAFGKVKAIISDGNRINQSFFNQFNTVERRPWLSVDGTYLLYDYVHLIKNIRNLRLTEKTGELKFQHENQFLVANWHHLRNLLQSEVCAALKMSNLIETAVNDGISKRNPSFLWRHRNSIGTLWKAALYVQI